VVSPNVEPAYQRQYGEVLVSFVSLPQLIEALAWGSKDA